MIMLISGGCKNGKTSIAEKIIDKLSNGKNMYYVATMIPYDNEDIKRIKNHIQERASYNFETIEVVDNFDLLKEKNGYFLFDSLTAYLLNHIVKNENIINDKNLNSNIKNDIDLNGDDLFIKIKNDIYELTNDNNKNIIFISDYIYSDAISYDNFTKFYIKTLAKLERYVAKISDVVLEISFGNIICYKGDSKIEKLLEFI